jgi:hypothetical protein
MLPVAAGASEPASGWGVPPLDAVGDDELDPHAAIAIAKIHTHTPPAETSRPLIRPPAPRL